MENATKALIIAAAILIAIVLISLGVFVLGQGTELIKENSDMSDVEIAAINSKFEPYLGDHVSATRVKQLINVLNQYNRKYSEDDADSMVIIVSNNRAMHGKLGYAPNYDPSAISSSVSYNVSIDPSGYTSRGLISEITIEYASN